MNLNEYISDTLLEIVFFNGEYLISGCMPASTVHAHMALRQNPPIFLRQGRPHLSQSLHAKSTHKSRHVTAGNKHTEQYRYWSESEIMPGLHCTSPLNFLGLFVWVHANHSSPARIIPPPPPCTLIGSAASWMQSAYPSVPASCACRCLQVWACICFAILLCSRVTACSASMANLQQQD